MLINIYLFHIDIWSDLPLMKTEKEGEANVARFHMIDDDAAKGTNEIEQPRRGRDY